MKERKAEREHVACAASPARQPVKDWHFDIVLLTKLKEGWQEPDQLGACYCVPPIGSFMEHVTGCSVDRPGRIPGHWGAHWQQDGTRRRDEREQHRWLAGYTQKGPPDFLGAGPVILPDQHKALRWLTQAPPGFEPPGSSDEEAPPARASIVSERSLKFVLRWFRKLWRFGSGSVPVMLCAKILSFLVRVEVLCN